MREVFLITSAFSDVSDVLNDGEGMPGVFCREVFFLPCRPESFQSSTLYTHRW